VAQLWIVRRENFLGKLVFADKTMKKISTVGLMAVCIVTSTLFVGCSSVSIPPAKSYFVRAGDTVFSAKSVKIHGSWAELETDHGPVWVSGAVIETRN
jgi:hypothetical protein